MKNFDKIERYLQNEMGEEEKGAFEKEVSQNPDLAEELVLQGVEEEAIDLMIEDELLKKVKWIASKKVEKDSVNEKPLIFFIPWMKMVIAASVLLIVGYYLFQNNNPTASEYNLLAMTTLAENRPNLSGSRSIEELDETQLEEEQYDSAITIGDQEEMEGAIHFFNHKKEVEANYKLGHAYLLNKEFEKSVYYFNKYLSTATEENRNRPQAAFYLAIAHLANDNTTRAVEEL
ncbi:MAG: hypothetical protein ACI9VN_000782, partial [Patescibacteria group bacterium]